MDSLTLKAFIALFVGTWLVVWYMEKKKGRIAFSLGGDQGKTIGTIKGDGGKLMVAELGIHLLHQKDGTRVVLEFTEGGRYAGAKFKLFAGFNREQITEIIEMLQKARNET